MTSQELLKKLWQLKLAFTKEANQNFALIRVVSRKNIFILISNNGQRKTIAYILMQFTFALMIFLANVWLQELRIIEK